MRRAQIIACAVEVLCPHCGGSQPNPDHGAFAWLPDEVRKEAAERDKRVCVECDETFLLVAENRVSCESVVMEQMDDNDDGAIDEGSKTS